MQSRNSATATAVAIIFLVLLLFPVIFNNWSNYGNVSDWWIDLVTTHETLLSGILAIAAAYLTINQMRESDQRQDIRHEDLLEASRGFEKLRLDRALNPQFDELKRFQADAERISSNFTHDGDRYVFDPITFAWQIEMFVTLMAETLNRPQFRDGEALFRGNLAAAIHALREKTMVISSDARRGRDASMDKVPDEEFDEVFAWFNTDGWDKLARYMVDSRQLLGTAIPELEQLSKTYKIELLTR